ncbi:hypothetical protein WICPIJ_008641 [Wickerhamomyces pijperi]|uniref:Uncharacterized protein n=1 Tax=Wickerhamomyces pijperi TaxID=599730 RepID=A0A9P8PXB1_WICPI|nr:hypothetical protein WICPIJ_008641 [Wickerhamomyces pijperi]
MIASIPLVPHSQHREVAPDDETFKKWRLYWKKFTRIQIRRPVILQAFHRLHLRHFHHSFDGVRYDPLKANRSSATCSLCFAAPDSIDHLLFGCEWVHHLWKNIIHQDPAHSALTGNEVYAPHWRRDEDEFIDINWFIHTILEVRRQRRSHSVLISADSQNLIRQELARVLNAKLREYEYTELLWLSMLHSGGS